MYKVQEVAQPVLSAANEKLNATTNQLAEIKHEKEKNEKDLRKTPADSRKQEKDRCVSHYVGVWQEMKTSLNKR